jgi:hypothetical protein
MRLRGFSPGCQPKEGFFCYICASEKYHSIIAYDRKLTDKELRDYEMDFIGEFDIK